MRAKFWFKITDQTSTIKFPLAKEIPWLDQTIDAIRYYYAIDPFESRYLMLLGTWFRATKENIGPELTKVFKNLPFVTSQEYVKLLEAWNAAIKVS